MFTCLRRIHSRYTTGTEPGWGSVQAPADATAFAASAGQAEMARLLASAAAAGYDPVAADIGPEHNDEVPAAALRTVSSRTANWSLTVTSTLDIFGRRRAQGHASFDWCVTGFLLLCRRCQSGMAVELLQTIPSTHSG